MNEIKKFQPKKRSPRKMPEMNPMKKQTKEEPKHEEIQ
jgi:hypothetical protein